MADLTSTLEKYRELADSPEAASFLYSFERILRKQTDHFFGSFGWDEDETAKGFSDLEKLAATLPRLLAALRAVLELADNWNALWPCASQVREAITRELSGKEESDGD